MYCIPKPAPPPAITFDRQDIRPLRANGLHPRPLQKPRRHQLDEVIVEVDERAEGSSQPRELDPNAERCRHSHPVPGTGPRTRHDPCRISWRNEASSVSRAVTVPWSSVADHRWSAPEPCARGPGPAQTSGGSSASAVRVRLRPNAVRPGAPRSPRSRPGPRPRAIRPPPRASSPGSAGRSGGGTRPRLPSAAPRTRPCP